MDKEVIEVYQFLCANMDYNKNGKTNGKNKWEGDGQNYTKI